MKTIRLALALAASLSAASGPLLVDNGRSSYSICLADDASPSERRGAAELQRFLEEISGARLPIVTEGENPAGSLILVGESRALRRLGFRIPFEALGAEGFALRTSAAHLAIAGGRPRGTMYGVYTFLEKLGCRWFTREVSRIPRMRTVRLEPLDVIQRPAFEYREPFITEAFDRDWAARNKTNGDHSLLDASTGGKVQYYPFVHSFYQMIPPGKYFAEHPEYFSLIDGKRRVERGQLCLTNPDVLRLGVEAVLEWIRGHPEATIYSVSQNDWEGWCECDNCRRVEAEEGGKHSGPILRYVNALAAEIEKQYPDKLIDTLAYWYSEEPPAHVRPRRNVRIRLCPIGVCEAHPYEKCPRSAYFMKNLRAWSRITGRLYIWHYNTNFSHYLVPFPDFDELAADIPMYRRHGVVGLFMEGSYPKGGGGENAELRAYVMARQLWDPAVNVEREVDEFLQAVYGKAAPFLRAYHDLAHRQVRAGMHIWINPVPDFSDEFLGEARELFAKASAAAETDAVRRRVRQARLPLEDLELLRAKTYSLRGEWYAPADLAGLKQRFAALLEELRGFGITSIHEGRSLDVDEQEMAALRPYRVTTLENSHWRVDLVPELSGRLMSLIDKRTNRDLLRRVDSGERSYPNVGGMNVSAYPDFHGRAWNASWQMAAPGELSAVLDNGLRLRRRTVLRDDAVHVETVAENAGPAPLEVALEARADFDPGDIERASALWLSRDGNRVEVPLIRPEEPPTGNATYKNGQVPAGEWRISGGGRAVVNRFAGPEVERTVLSWTAKGPSRVTLALWSKKRILAPGESLRLEADYSAPR